ncbi:hypothetical protein QJS10_CPA01g00646 [Acorus calamus]|uniref:WAT1-related protein n=1 Tax=Acorus calamus TaxID=4465 RepID=A0AAV9DRE2_ACOCL|nr:hypothetical protein QJS10_CPB11g01896 [Acorus calamus]KAK1325038.1 hypothetical protein QJS10_CPA01g00646 [Acorus calamus]
MEKMKEPMSMLLVQIMGTGMMILSKIILSEGVSIFPLLAFRNLVGAVCVAPLAFSLERVASIPTKPFT